MRKFPTLQSKSYLMNYVSSNKEQSEKMETIIKQSCNLMDCVSLNKDTSKRIKAIIESKDYLEKELIAELKQLNFSDLKKFLNFNWSIEDLLKFIRNHLWRLHFIEIQKRLSNSTDKEETIKTFKKDIHLLYYYKNLL